MAPTPPQPLPEAALRALQRGQTIEAIKQVRLATGLGLKEAKDVVDAHRRGAAAGSAGLPRAAGGRLAPGEVPQGGAGPWPWALALAAAALLAYWMLGGKG